SSSPFSPSSSPSSSVAIEREAPIAHTPLQPKDPVGMVSKFTTHLLPGPEVIVRQPIPKRRTTPLNLYPKSNSPNRRIRLRRSNRRVPHHHLLLNTIRFWIIRREGNRRYRRIMRAMTIHDTT
ncbi:hypothetical protein FRB95_006894, partial [Tulasnella sp. JGI-2019a]